MHTDTDTDTDRHRHRHTLASIMSIPFYMRVFTKCIAHSSHSFFDWGAEDDLFHAKLSLLKAKKYTFIHHKCDSIRQISY